MTSITSGFNNNIIKTLQFIDQVVTNIQNSGLDCQVWKVIIYKKINLRNIFHGFFMFYTVLLQFSILLLQYSIPCRVEVSGLIIVQGRGRCHRWFWGLNINC